MNSVLFQIAYVYIKWIFIVFAFIALLRGHNYPGGGFIAGLIASLIIAYKGFAYNFKDLKQQFSKNPLRIFVAGLVVLLLSFIPSLLLNEPLMKGIWFSLELPLNVKLKLGTPFLFDIGVFLVVTGISTSIILSLINDKED